MRRILRRTVAIVALLAIAVGGLVLWLQRPLVPAIRPPPHSAFEPALVEKGARLAAIGDCRACHTAPGGTAYAGNRPIATPSGTLYSPNITPAPGDGIGRWSEEAFRRALREGVSRRGGHLYPAFPYDHYARVGDDDIRALYAFMMTRPPLETYQHPNDFPLSLGQTWPMTLWNLAFLDDKPFRPDPRHDAEWNRGAYLVEGLGHCGSCHTPRNWLAAEKTGEALDGGSGEGWRGPALNANSPAPVPWNAAQLFAYLRQGWDGVHGAAAGPMQPVVEGLARADEADVRAIAAYLAARQGEPSPDRRRRAEAAQARAAAPSPPKPAPGEELGAALFAGACAACHTGGPAMVAPRGVNLALSTAISEADPRNAIRIVLDGVRPGEGRAGPWMPRFNGAFTDAQLTALLAYVRAHYGSGPAWDELASDVSHLQGSATP